MPADARTVAIDWRSLEDAFSDPARDVAQYLHVPTGSVVRLPDDTEHIEACDEYVRLETVTSRTQYQWMAEFAETFDHGELRRELSDALVGRGCFRRFKDVLVPHASELKRWFAFRRSRLRGAISTWLEAQGLIVISPAVRLRLPDHAAQLLTEQSMEEARARLAVLSESLGERDLVALETLARFLELRKRLRIAARERTEAAAEDALGDVSDATRRSTAP